MFSFFLRRGVMKRDDQNPEDNAYSSTIASIFFQKNFQFFQFWANFWFFEKFDSKQVRKYSKYTSVTQLKLSIYVLNKIIVNFKHFSEIN